MLSSISYACQTITSIKYSSDSVKSWTNMFFVEYVILWWKQIKRRMFKKGVEESYHERRAMNWWFRQQRRWFCESSWRSLVTFLYVNIDIVDGFAWIYTGRDEDVSKGNKMEQKGKTDKHIWKKAINWYLEEKPH